MPVRSHPVYQIWNGHVNTQYSQGRNNNLYGDMSFFQHGEYNEKTTIKKI